MNADSYNIDLILKKVSNFCAYRERSSFEVTEKLKSFGCSLNDSEKILQYLYSENFINDERFAKLFAGSKFRINKWGKYKIAAALKQKKISNTFISSALDSLNNDEYIQTLVYIIEKKINELQLKEFNEIDIIKIENYALQKGYEKELVIKTINKLLKSKN